jgi:membrane-bound lytic murein transglycosylase B
MRVLSQLGLIGLLLLIMSGVHADWALVQRQDVQLFVNDLVKRHHFDRKEIIHALAQAKFQPKIIESMERPYEKKPWDVYRDIFLTQQRVQAGLSFWHANKVALAQAERQFGVPAEVIVAIIGVETLYGNNQGNYRVLDALTTLAFDYPKRSEFFTKELREYLLLCREHGVSPTQYMGSYAGAMGKPQFMPSSYRFYAVNFRGHGKVDLMKEDSDAISSVANYFHQHRWKWGQLVAQPAVVRGVRYRHLVMNAKFPNYSFRHLVATGVRPLRAVAHHPDKAGVIELMTQHGEDYWLAYPNFYVITRYNTSPQYALVVYLLSQQLKSHWMSVSRTVQAHS